jgi:hypothetical protein
MAINQTAYDTAACGAYPVSSYQEHLQRALPYTPYAKVAAGGHESGFELMLVSGGGSFIDVIPPFKHPVLVTRPSNHAQRHVLGVDVRDFGKLDINGKFQVRNGYEYAWHLRRAILNQLWIDGRVEQLRDVSSLPAVTYASFMADNIGWRFNLDQTEQITVRVLAAYFYYGLFTDSDDFSELEKSSMMGKIAQFTRTPINKVEELLKNQPIIHTLEGFCDLVKQKINNIALENFNLGTLSTIFRGNWFGSNSNEIIAVALEHIPTWLAVISASLSSAVYRRSNLAKTAQRYDKNGLGSSMLTSLEILMGGAQAVRKYDGEQDTVYAEQFNN